MKNDEIFFSPKNNYTKERLREGISHKKFLKKVKTSLVAFVLITGITIGNIGIYNSTNFSLEEEIAYLDEYEYTEYYDNILENDEEFWNLK